MVALLNTLLVIVMLLNLVALGTSRIHAVIQTVALQGVLLGILALLVHEHVTIEAVFVVVATVAFKGVVIPLILRRAMREVQIAREVEPLIGLVPSMLLGAVATALALVFAGSLPLVARHVGSLIAPAALSTALVGCILLTTRAKAISQALGYLVLENGIFIFGLLLIDAMPFLVEVGVLLDLLVGVFVLGIIMNHIRREFSSMDTRNLASLKE